MTAGETSRLLRAARIEGLETLRECALRKLASGVTTFEEVARATVDVA